VHPAPSSVSLAFAAAGTHWDDAVVVSAHGRDPDAAVAAAARHPKVGVLCSPACPPEELGRLLAGAPVGVRSVTVAGRLGEPDEAVWQGDLAGLAAGRFDPLSVVVIQAPAGSDRAGLAWGRDESEFEHRGGMITKAEVRAVALGKLALPQAGVLWDVGAGSGSVSSECARLAPGLRIFAVERSRPDIPMLQANLEGTAATVVAGTAPEALVGLPDPDRAFVGGGGIEVLDAVVDRLRPGGSVVATYASPARAAEAGARLGHMVQINVNRGVPAGPGRALRLAAENPVFVCWGPEA
jgi:precorrin-6Y C5,15-methyltransferase (decarboxylating)